MPTLSPSPRLLKGRLILIDPDSSAVQRAIALQYNPDTLNRSLQAQSADTAAEGADPLRHEGRLKRVTLDIQRFQQK